MANPFTEIVNELLDGCASATMAVERADAHGCDWNVDSALGQMGIEMPFGSDDYDVAAKVRAACNKAHLYASITHPQDGRVETLIVR